MTRWISLAFTCALLAAPSSATAEVLVGFRMEAVDALNQPLTSIPLGGQFTLRGYVEDLRVPVAPLHGVASAYVSVAFDSGKVVPNGLLAVDPFFNLFTHSVLNADSLAAGGFGLVWSIDDVPEGEQLLFSLPMQATNLGLAVFTPQTLPHIDFEWLFYGIEYSILPDEIALAPLELNVVPEPASIGLSGVALAGLGLVAFRRRRT